MFDDFIRFVKLLYSTQEHVQLHAPVFLGKEKEYIADCIDSTFVSYVGKYVAKFEEMTAAFTGAKYAIATVNGTAALQIALQVSGIEPGDEVITQPLTFVATANAIAHAGAIPVFVDVDLTTMGLSPEKLADFLHSNCEQSEDGCINKTTRRRVKAIVPMHTFGHPCRIDEIVEIADKYNIIVIEDSAESLGSYYKNKHTGTFGLAGIFSYNGNKTITTGGGGMIVTDNESIAQKAKHITTTGKKAHQWEYVHDMVAYNYRLTNVSAALGVAQMELIQQYLRNKRETAGIYKKYFMNSEILFFVEPENASSNYWLNVIQLENRELRDKFLQETNANKIITRPIWRLMNKLEMYKNCQTGNLETAEWLEDRVVNIPSGYRV